MFLWLIFWISHTIVAWGQPSSFDVALKKISTATSNNYISLMAEVERLISPIKDTLRVKELTKRLIEQAKKHPNERVYLSALITTARLLGDKRIKDTNLARFSMVLEAYKLATKGEFRREQAEAAKLLSKFYNAQGTHEKALYYALEAVDLFEQLGMPALAADSYHDMASAYYQAWDWANAEKYYKKLLEYTPQGVPQRIYLDAWNALGLIRTRQKRYDEALLMFNKIYQIAVIRKDTVWLGILRGNIGEVLGEQGKYDTAQQLLADDIRISLQCNEINNAVISARISAVFYIRNRQYAQARQQLDLCQRLLPSIKRDLVYLGIIMRLLETEAIYYTALKQHEKAYQFLNQSYHIKDSFYVTQREASIKRTAESYDVRLKQEQIENLSKENTYHQKVIASQRFSQALILVMLGLLLGASIIMYRLLIIRQQINNTLKTQFQEIEDKNYYIESQNKAISAQNEEMTQQREEITSQRDLIEMRNTELEFLNRRMLNNELILRKAYQKLKANEQVIKQQNQKLLERGESLEAQVQERTQEIVQKNQELISYSNQLEQFAYITAHNIRAPVARMLGLGSLFNWEQFDCPDNRLIMEKMIVVSRELDTIIKDLNTILEIRKGVGQLSEDVNIAHKCDKIFKLLENQIHDSRAEIITNFAGGEILFGVAVYVESILYNLISNAIKYRDPLRSLRLSITTEQTAEYFILSVRDNGLGMDLERHSDKIFGLYKRFHDHVEGKGIGLHMVKLQVEAMGGTIEVESALGKGTTFYLKFRPPASSETHQDPQNTTTEPSSKD